MPKPVNPLIKIQKTLDSLKLKSAKLSEEVSMLGGLIAELAKTPAPAAAVVAPAKKPLPGKAPAKKGTEAPKKRGRPAKAK
jgi:hypothetical protein